MSAPGEHPTEALQDLVLDRLDPANRAHVESHLDSCEKCRSELDGLKLLRRCLARSASDVKAPDALRQRIREKLDAENVADVATPPGGLTWRPALAWGAPLLIAAMLLTVFWLRPAALPQMSSNHSAASLIAEWSAVPRSTTSVSRFRSCRLRRVKFADPMISVASIFGQLHLMENPITTHYSITQQYI